MVAMFLDRLKFREQFSKTVTQGTILWNYFKIWQAVSKENFEIFLWSADSEKSPDSPTPHGSHVFWRIKISRTIFDKCHTRNNLNSLPFTTQSPLLTTLKKEPFENIVGKEENAGNQNSLFPPRFLSYPEQILPFGSPSFLSSANAFNLDWFKILSFG